jgi:mRNA-degrading endonuclease toxin of MazEF toxin-antitoxin module
MERGDVYLVSLDPTEGHEQRGRRPVLILSKAAFNRLTGTPLVVPITGGGNFARHAGFAVSLSGAERRRPASSDVISHACSTWPRATGASSKAFRPRSLAKSS